LDLHGGSRLHKRLVPGGLAAVAAVFRASAGFDRQQRALLDLGGVPVHAVDRGGAVHELVERQVINGGYFAFGPVVTDLRRDAPHGPLHFGPKEGVPFADVVRQSAAVGDARRGRRV
jgi:hypothetical protein